MSEFEAHGETGFEVRGRILVFRPRSGSNQEEVERMLTKIQAVLPQFAGKPWGTMSIIDEALLMTPGAESRAQSAYLEMLQLGLVGQALVMADSPGRVLIERITRRMYGAPESQLRFFDTEAAAEQWLLGLIEKSAD
jgi:hypothetical protein